MKKFILFLLALISLTSCLEYKFSGFESLDLEFEGVSMLKYRELGETMGYIGEIQAEGAKISIVGKGKFAKYTYINIYSIDSISSKDTGESLSIFPDEKPAEESKLTMKGEWGEIRNTQENKIFITIKPNNSNKLREFMFYVGGGYEYSKVRVKQPPMTTE